MTGSGADVGQHWDAVVVGAGPAGCAAAAGLAGSGRRVLLIEAGPGEPRPASVAGLDIIAAAEEPTRQWAGMMVRDAPGGPLRAYRQGRGLGGGSMINALLLAPGDRRDYRRWEQDHHCRGWGPDAMEPWLTRVSRRIPGGQLNPGPLTGAFVQAAADRGHPVGGSSMDQDRLGVIEARLAIDGLRRRSAVDAYLQTDDALVGDGAGLTIRSGATVGRILIDGTTVTGVELADGERVRSPLVVLCAGAIATPQLLLASGVVRPPVGGRLKDHPSFAFTIGLRSNGNRQPGGPGWSRSISRLLRWSSGPEEHGDLQAFVIERVDGEGQAPMAVVVVGLMRVDGTGSIRSENRSPAAVTLGGEDSAGDRHRLALAVRDVHRLLGGDAMSPLVDTIHIDDRGTPAEALTAMTDDQLHRWLLAHPGPYSHPAGSCPMGPESDPRSVTSCEPAEAGRLLGHDGLYVADASIMPDLVQCGLQLPVMAVAERVTAAILATHR